ncbi:MAG: ABC transporter ATP-binding protein [Acidobacteriota bacterium]
MVAPGSPHERSRRNLSILRRLLPYVLSHIGLVGISILLLPLLAVAQLLQPYLVRVAIDEHISPAVAGQAGALDGVGLLLVVFVAILLAELALRFAQIYLMQLAGQRIMHDLRSAIFRHIQSLSMSFFDRNPVGRTMTRVTSDVETLNELVSQGIVAMARDIVTLVGIVGVMLWVDWRLTLASFVVVPCLVAILAFLRVRLRSVYERARTLVARQNAFLQETISGMEVVQAFVQERHNRRQFKELRGEILDVELRGVHYSSWLSASVQAATTTSTGLVLAYGGFGIIGGTVTVGILVQFLEYLRRFYQPLEDLSDKYDTLQRAAAACTKVFGLLDVRPEVNDATTAVSLPGFHNAIRFDSVTFTYPSMVTAAPGPVDGIVGSNGDPLPVLRDLALTIHKGEKVALVGATGAGKSSVIKLLQRYYDVQDGEITIDGVDIRNLPQRQVRLIFGTVPQDVFLFSDTIAANIGLHSPEVSRAAVERAARTVEADTFIRELPDGFDTRLGERGSNLSFGERQLLAFARALAFDSPVLILDEATSSVDSETEARIQRALRRLIADRTALIVAHRLSTIRRVDRIIVLHHGEVREEGTHEELLARDGLYACLYRLQHQEMVGAD